MPTAPVSTHQRTSSDWIALLALVILGGLQIYFFDITFHGPDQIRDVEIARKLIHNGVWPLNGPPLFGERFSLPPGFYYLLALPLLIRDTEAAIFVAFGALFALSVGYLWRTVRAKWGSRSALVYAALAFPVFASLYTHSAWNPALVMTLSNLVLGLFIRFADQYRHAGLALPLAAYLLVQIHPSAAPLLLGFTAYALCNCRAVLNRWTLTALGVLAALTAGWAFQSGLVEKLKAPVAAAATAAPGSPSSHGWMSNLLDAAKWCDAFLMPYHAIESILPAIPGLGSLTAVLLIVTLVGVLLGFAVGMRDRAVRWIAITTALWFVASMAFLSQGAFWHLDVVHPWLAVMAAYGWARTSEKLPTLRFNALAVALLAVVVTAHATLYRQFERKGNYDLVLATLFFPQLAASEHKIPAYTFRYLREARDSLASLGVCREQVTGLEAMVIGNAVNRVLDTPCAAGKRPLVYFMAREQDALAPDALPFEFTKGLQPVATVGASAIYAVPDTGTLVNAAATSNILSNRRLNYMTYLPARLENGLSITVAPAPHNIVRVALRCGRDYPVEQQARWTVEGARYAKPLATKRVRYLGSVYYDLEWGLTQPTGHGGSATVSWTQGPLDCDVSAVARPTIP